MTPSERAIAWKQANPEKYRANMIAARLRRYGLTPEQYYELLAEQGGHCAICPTEPTEKRRLAVDHDHKTGLVRGLLCHTCNNHLGIYERRSLDFAGYLERYR